MEESYVSLTELKVILDKEKAARGELNPEQQYSLSHASLFARVPPEKVPLIVKELMEIPMMSPFNAVKIADLMPTHLDDVRAIFAKERFSSSKEDAEKVLDFFNRAQAITTRFHMLELLPGLGKKTMWAILEERKKGPFKSFQDLDARVPSIHHPERLVAKRIEMEISDPTQKYRLFVAR